MGRDATALCVLATLGIISLASGAIPRQLNFSSLGSDDGFLISSASVARLGFSSSFLDFDGDGHSDLAVSATMQQNGRVYVIYGPLKTGFTLPTAFNTSTGFYVDSETYGNFGYSVHGGDLNGDSLDDLVITTFNTPYLIAVVWGRKERDMPALTVSSLVSNKRGITFYGPPQDTLGLSSRIIPSVNGDRYNDLIIGVSQTNPTGDTAKVGAVYLVNGHGGTWDDGITLANGALFTGITKIWGDPTKTNAGHDVAGCRDINGDGIGDFVYTAPSFKEVYVVFGRTDGKWLHNASEINGGNGFVVTGSYDQFGISVDCGDINGDGHSDLIVGSNGYTAIVYGRNGTWNKSILVSPKVPFGGEVGFIAQGSGYAGQFVRVLGDVNGDRINDIGIGAPQYGEIAQYAGAAHILHGKRSAWSSPVNLDSTNPSLLTVYASSSPEFAGQQLSSNCGNIDDDPRGLCDVVIGAYVYKSNTGRAAVVFGTFWPLNCKTRDPSTGGCSSCEGAFGLVNGTCLICSSVPNGFLDANGFCIVCGNEGCQECDSHGVCTKCKPGYSGTSCSAKEATSWPSSLVAQSSSVPPSSHQSLASSGVQEQISSVHAEVSIVLTFDPAAGVTSTDAIANEIATAIGVPVQLVTVTFVSSGEVLVTIKGFNAVTKAEELTSIVNNQQCN